MTRRPKAEQKSASSTDAACGARSGGTLLIVEPEPLLRWSLVTYLGRWFEVIPAESVPAALRTLDDHAVDAVVVSDDLCDRAAEQIEAHARSRNSSARVVRTITSPSQGIPGPGETPCLEKPFLLARLATLLGVLEPAPPDRPDLAANRAKRD